MELIYLLLLLVIIASALVLTRPAVRDRLFPQPQPVRVYSPRREARMMSSDSFSRPKPLQAEALTTSHADTSAVSAAPRVRVDDPTPLFSQLLQSYRDRGIDMA